jgi:hypothetical protein
MGVRAPQPPPPLRQLQQARLPPLVYRTHDGASVAGRPPQLPLLPPRRAREPRQP